MSSKQLPIVVASVAAALAARAELVAGVDYEPGSWDWSGPEEGDTVDLTVVLMDSAGTEIFEIADSGDVETDKQLGREIAAALNEADQVAGRVDPAQAPTSSDK